jgi:hypothetical protein
MTFRRPRSRLAALAAAAAFGLGGALVLLGAGCQDLREYAGGWSGEVSSDPALAQGFAPGATVSLDVSVANRDKIAFVAKWQGRSATFVPIRRAAGDALSDAQLPGEPLRTFFGFLQPSGEAPYLAVVSLFPENRLELRLIRGADEIYGVFSLHRTIAPAEKMPAGPTP